MSTVSSTVSVSGPTEGPLPQHLQLPWKGHEAPHFNNPPDQMKDSLVTLHTPPSEQILWHKRRTCQHLSHFLFDPEVVLKRLSNHNFPQPVGALFIVSGVLPIVAQICLAVESHSQGHQFGLKRNRIFGFF